ncbi:probable G1/S-specific cyclin CLN1 [Zygosaccharomyces bailii]|nr:probable G1/S-specific cyclin CLN1 [Zygosaccharomyces bailii]
MACDTRLGLNVTAKQTYYPIELSNAELLAHYETVQEYHQEISANALTLSSKFKPDAKLIDQQPEMTPTHTRSAIVTFLFELSIMSRVTDGIFYHAVRLYDRYCSKRVVLQDQAKLVVATCLWLAAKTWGGCNHVINNISIPTGGRFYGPNPRARIPRLSELIHYCGGADVFDESMFMQMERHILDTLSWDVYEPMINDYVLNVDENCLIQYELYKRQLEHNKEWVKKRQSQQSHDSDATVDVDEDDEENVYEDEEDEDLEMKIQLINLKRFLIDLSTWQYDLLKYEMFEVSHGIFSMLSRFTDQDQGPFLMTPLPSTTNQAQVLNVFINAVAHTPASLLEVYKERAGVIDFVSTVKNYQADLHKKLQLASAMDLSRRSVSSARYFDQLSTAPSPTYSQHYTPMRNTSTQSDNSVFSTNMDQSSPITPQIYSFGQYANDGSTCGSACGSTLSVNSITNKNSYEQQQQQQQQEDKENQMATHQLPPRAKFLGNGMFASPSGTVNSANSSNRSSIISLAIGNVNTMA